MKSISKLKDDARRHEQKEEWEKAIQIYLQVLQIGEEGEGEVELPLYNRVGDLAARLGRAKDAVRYYEQAADRYAEAGLYNNAIALCNKALRYGPDRLEILKKLGQFSASQGFITDARRYYLEYAEKRFAAGEIDDAFESLTDFANIADDVEVREMLGRRLHAHGRNEEAIAELRRAYAMRESAGDLAGAELLRDEMLAIDPGAFRLPVPAIPSFEDALIDPADSLALEDNALSEIDSGAFGDDTSGAALAGLESTALSDGDAGLDFGTVQLSDFESGAALAGSDADPTGGTIEGLESTALDFGSIPPDMVEDIGIDRDETSFDLPGLDDDDAPPLPMLHDPDEGAATTEIDSAGNFDEDGYSIDDLPLLGDTAADAVDEDVAFDLPAPGASGFEDSEFTLPTFGEDEAPAEEAAAAADFTLPDLDSAGTRFELPDFDAGLDEDDAIAPLPTFEGFESSLTLPGVEDDTSIEDGLDQEAAAPPAAAFEVEDLAAAEHIAEAASAELAGLTPPEPERARAPEPPLAPPARDEPPAAAPPRIPAAPAPATATREDSYVDLFALVTDDEEETTRFQVQETSPTGDEDRDFAELLSQFKAKVSEHLPAEDAVAHYDLGLAFKEMGLIDEAIAEFQIALRAGHMRLKVHEEIGHAFLLKEQYNIAEKVLRRALDMKYNDELELLGVYYHLGRAYEGMGKRDQARDAYERVLGLDINFQDVNERLARL
jgi:tetratricopeptide (TPR) repeat protein